MTLELEAEGRISEAVESTTIFRSLQRWTESEKLTPKPDPAPMTKAPNPDSVSLQILDSESSSGSGSAPISTMLLHTFYKSYHSYRIRIRLRIFPKNSNPDSSSDPKNVAGHRIRSAPNLPPCASLSPGSSAGRTFKLGLCPKIKKEWYKLGVC